jgi:predicted MFS family arabinose efflux permease
VTADPTRRAATATRGFFLLCGVGAATWATLVPLARARLGLDEAQLGVVLLCMGIGSVAAMPAAGWLGHRHGNRAVMIASALWIVATLPLLAIAPSPVALGALLVGFGGAMGVLDVAMNAHAVDVERRHARPLMSGFHGLFSVGGLVGALAMSGLLRTGLPPVACALAMTALLAAVLVTQRPHLLAHVRAEVSHAPFARPSATTLLLGVLCLVTFLAEGAMLDWSAVFLHDVRGLTVAGAGLGYAAFSIAMAVGRLLGDRITAALGAIRIVRYGGLVAAAGFVLATALPYPAASLIGFVLVGIGASNIVPVLFSAAGRVGISVISLATVTALGYAGMLAGPAVIGFVARATSLAAALGGIAALLFGVAVLAPVVRRGAAA